MYDFEIIRGVTFSRVLRWQSAPLIYTPITGITQAGPAVITAAGHGLVTGWRVAVVDVGGMRQINARNRPLRPSDFYRATVIDPNTIALNNVSSVNFTAFTSGGSLVSYSPVSLAGYSAAMQMRETAEAPDPPLVSLVSPTDIVLDDVNHTITITMSATATDALTFLNAVYDLELTSPTGVVTQLISGAITTIEAVTQ